NWAGDLWFESEGLPLRFVQAGALLRQRDRLRAGAGAVDEFGVFEDARPDDVPPEAAADADEVPLPALGEAAAPAPLLASRLSARSRLAAGVMAQREAAGYADGPQAQARTAGQHYAWWAGHPSVTPERVCAESDALLAALGVLAPQTTAVTEGEPSAAVQ